MVTNKATHWLIITVAVGALCAGAVPCKADLFFEAVGNPLDGGSWYQAFHLSTQTAFDHAGLALGSLPGDSGTSGFESPAWDFETIDGNPYAFQEDRYWPHVTVASGDVTDELFWQTHFAGDKEEQRFALALFVWDDSFLSIQAAGALWDGSSWTFRVPCHMTWEEFAAAGGIAAVPAPSAAVLGLLGLGLVGGVRRRQR